jgi:hypothetical protein
MRSSTTLATDDKLAEIRDILRRWRVENGMRDEGNAENKGWIIACQ